MSEEQVRRSGSGSNVSRGGALSWLGACLAGGLLPFFYAAGFTAAVYLVVRAVWPALFDTVPSVVEPVFALLSPILVGVLYAVFSLRRRA
jgi:hypothetical protein